MPPIEIQDQRPEQSAVHVMKGKERRAMYKHSFPRPSPKNNQQAIQLIPADVTAKTGMENSLNQTSYFHQFK